MDSDAESVGSARQDENPFRRRDPYHLKSGDTSNLILVAEPLGKSNYITWSKAMLRAFRSRGKLKFLTGEIRAPDFDDPSFDRWDEVNSTLTSWILNAISMKLARGFMFYEDVYTLWCEIRDRFGESNSPLLLKLRTDINELKQGNDSIAVYYTNLKGLWDEFNCLRPRKRCSAGCVNYDCLPAEDAEDKLSQFLMGLNKEYNEIGHQILLIVPSPSVSRACQMIPRIEKQREVHGGYEEAQNDSAMAARTNRDTKASYQPNYVDQYDDANMVSNVKRPDLRCEHCGKPGHIKQYCYKLVGYPGWWDPNRRQGNRPPQSQRQNFAPQVIQREQEAGPSSYQKQHASQNVYKPPHQRGAQQNFRYTAHAAVEEEETPIVEHDGGLQALVARLVEAQLEIKLKGKAPMVEHPGAVNYAHYHDFAGPQD